MKIERNRARTFSLPIYFILTFSISWGAILILTGLQGIPAPADQRVSIGLAMLLGPSLASIVLTGFTSGKAGFRRFLSQFTRWRAGAPWYAVALLTAPLSSALVISAISLFSREVLPVIPTTDNLASLIIMSVGGGLLVGFCEELGWTGFAVPLLRLRNNTFATGSILGLLWGLWHLLMFWEDDSFSGALPLALLLARLFSWLPAYRILMVWVYDHTDSLPLVMLMHVSLVITSMIINPSQTGGTLLIFILVRAVVFWFIVNAVILADRRQFERPQSK
jgi:membrane protease YdiL (CAAX protease family)